MLPPAALDKRIARVRSLDRAVVRQKIAEQAPRPN
jgi:hypothetical protein